MRNPSWLRELEADLGNALSELAREQGGSVWMAFGSPETRLARLVYRVTVGGHDWLIADFRGLLENLPDAQQAVDAVSRSIENAGARGAIVIAPPPWHERAVVRSANLLFAADEEALLAVLRRELS